MPATCSPVATNGRSRTCAVFVAGFADFTRTQLEILEVLSHWMEELWIALPNDVDESRAELFSQPRMTLRCLQSLQPRVIALEPPSSIRDQRSEVRGQRSEIRGQRSEVRGQRSEVRGQRSEISLPTSDLRPLTSDIKGQRSEISLPTSDLRPLTSDIKGQRSEISLPTSDFRPLTSDLPAALAHLERQLFKPLRRIHKASDTAGIMLIEAPGVVGETRMVARHIKKLLSEVRGQRSEVNLPTSDFRPLTSALECTPAEDILVTMRDIAPYADIVREVFTEYGIPVDMEGAEPILRNRALATLLRSLRLPGDDWPFAAVAALLRSDYFRPDWPELREQPGIAQHAEVLLRLLGEPRGRDAYLEAARRWADDPPAGLEDEQAEESRRVRKHELAKKCRPFLDRFFRAWDGMPQKAALEEHVSWLLRFAADLGLARVAAEQPSDAAALRRLEEELHRWVALEHELHGKQRMLEQKEFIRRLAALMSEAALARTPRPRPRTRPVGGTGSSLASSSSLRDGHG